jgi:hypothetical protein
MERTTVEAFGCLSISTDQLAAMIQSAEASLAEKIRALRKR